jgi:D-sedoheptulose 7-phosphate isomerase
MSQLPVIQSHFAEARETLTVFMNNENNFRAIEQAAEVISASVKAGGKVISCGNGGSMCDAMHFAEELSGRYRDNRPGIAAIAISDPSYLTCAGNDYGFEFVFSRFVEAVGKKGDVLLAISTSGNSANVIKAAEAARAAGIKVIGLTGKDGGKMAALCDVEIRAPHTAYADRAQEIHIKVIHCIIDLIERTLFK